MVGGVEGYDREKVGGEEGMTGRWLEVRRV